MYHYKQILEDVVLGFTGLFYLAMGFLAKVFDN